MITRLCLAAALMLAAGCARAGDDEVAATSAPATTVPAGTTLPATPPPTTDPTVEPTTDPPPPDATLPPDVPGYLAALREVSPEMAADPQRAVRRGQGTCQEVLAGKPASTLVTNAAARFSDGGKVLDQAAGARIVAAAQGYLCPGAGPGR